MDRTANGTTVKCTGASATHSRDGSSSSDRFALSSRQSSTEYFHTRHTLEGLCVCSRLLCSRFPCWDSMAATSAIPSIRPSATPSHRRGTKLFMGSCAGCHGPDGGGGARGPNLVRRSLWHPLSDDAIFQVIRKGVPGTDMPPTKLTDEQTWNLVAFIHALTGPASTNPVPGDPAAGKAVIGGEGRMLELSCHSRKRRPHGARP